MLPKLFGVCFNNLLAAAEQSIQSDYCHFIILLPVLPTRKHLPFPFPYSDCFSEIEQQDRPRRPSHRQMLCICAGRHPWSGLQGKANPCGPPTHLFGGQIPGNSCGYLIPPGPAADPLLHSFFQEVLLETDGIKCYLKSNSGISALSDHVS